MAVSGIDRAGDAALFAALIRARSAAARDELAWLGVSHAALTRLLARHGLPDVDAAWAEAALPSEHAAFVDALRARLLADANPAVDPDDARCLASIVSHACLRPDHLWRDLGLDGREAVSAMLTRFFPAVAARNTGQLRWKKFLAQDLALSRGEAPAPAPGCPGCEDYGHCFPAPHDRVSPH
ncbi:nitrogen fixation protein NifQ [Burkholderia sp. Ac-20379]|uniref:nitrogen fixation protein NifQ n=1 Tax=Burkholderia sp. Ac-20379 TaxID=2703900 RepID=UPI00197D649B|nr:nitrogen fixation protein NifQ [Burkholderia sp. Ac-20379]